MTNENVHLHDDETSCYHCLIKRSISPSESLSGHKKQYTKFTIDDYSFTGIC
jgi:hypothetical protein